MKLFTSKNDQNSSWPEYCLYMVAVSYTCRKGAKARVLDNIVYYASADLSPVLIAKLNVNLIGYLREAEVLAYFVQSFEVDSRVGKSLGREAVAIVVDST
ncbi:unnamed protein product [Hyaloperonospora brassicae]|uniref:Uncharacterized protein n=1 Tax=Hyaloperonospora brassicae TaxID=162125 RepID=A0AAV0V8G2_HYABA|nr:unnamed protein product [Hyaloperonospora brassicae]